MISIIEEDLYKIIQSVIQKSEVVSELYDCRINMDIIGSRDKINLINNLKTFFKSNFSNPTFSVVFSKHLSIVLSRILFKCLDDNDQNVRIASDECINLIIRLSTPTFTPYITYNLFIEIKSNQSSRSLNGALVKFANLCSLIKNSKRLSYINNVLPVLKVIVNRSEESVALTLVETLPKIAANLFPYASDSDIEKGFLLTLLTSLKNTSVVSNQRNLSNLISITCFHMKNPKIYVEKLLQYILSIEPFNESSSVCSSSNDNNEHEIRAALFVMKSLIVSCQNYQREQLNLQEFVLVLIRLIDIIDNGNLSASIKNLTLDCLLQILLLNNNNNQCSILSRFLVHSEKNELLNNREILKEIHHDNVFEFEEEEEEAGNDNDNDEELIEKSLEESDMIFEEDLRRTDLLEIENYERVPEKSVEDLIEGEGEIIIMEMENEEEEVNYEEPVGYVGDKSMNFGSFASWSGDTMSYLVKMLIVEFLPESFPNNQMQVDRQGNIRINSKVLAINCLTQICRMNYIIGLNSISVLNGSFCIPSIVDCVLKFYDNEDAQLSGSAISLLAQILSSHFSQLKYHVNKDQSLEIVVDWKKIIEIIQSQINNPASGQHLKSVLSAVKLFLYDMISTEYGPMVIDICESVLRYTDHKYKLVKKEILLICQAVDFRNLSLFSTSEKGPEIVKKISLADKFISAVLDLLGDVEQDIRDDACESLLFLIKNGAFDNEKFIFDCSCALYSDISMSSLTDKSRLIPFLHQNINVRLSDIRKKLQRNCNYHNTESTVHRAVQLIIERLLSNPIASTKEMKLSLSEISGCVHALLVLHEKYPISTHSKVWIGSNITDKNNLTETKTLISYCLSLLNTSLIISDICLHTDILCLISKLIFHGGIKHLILNDITSERTHQDSGINTQLNNNIYLVHAIKQFMTHLCRIMNIYWHIFQFLTPSIPPHKTVLPNLSSQTHASPTKKKTDTGPSKGSSESQSAADFRPPRTKTSLGFFVTESNYMIIHKHFSIAYNSYLISFDSSLHNDRLLNLLIQCINNLGSTFEFLTFSEVSMHIEELLSYCLIFYNVLPIPTVNLIIKLLGSLFGTNITAQWDPFLCQLFHQLFSTQKLLNNKTDLAADMIESWKTDFNKNGPNLQIHMKNISTSPDGNDTMQIYKWKQTLSDTFLWVKSSGKRREPGILRQIASTNSIHRPSLGHYIGLFEKHVFQCMRQYQVSSTELQTSIIDLLCQLIYLRVNYCQLDSEQKFLNIIQNQLESFTSYNIDNDKDGSLIIEITEFLILISYEKSAGNKKDEPILNITQVIRCIESLLVNGINVKPVILSCMWKIVCDLFVHRSLWLNNPGSFNLLPNTNTIKEIEVQRETIVEFLLRKLMKFPETLEILTLILEHSAREQEIKWQKLSFNIWSRLAGILFDDSIEFSNTAHIDHLQRLLCLLSIKVLTQSSMNKGLVDLVVKFEDNYSKIQDIYSSNIIQIYQCHIIQAVRSIVCLQIILNHNFDYLRDYKASKLINDLEDEDAIKQEFFQRIIEIFDSILKFYLYSKSNQYLRDTIDYEYSSMARKLIKTFVLILINLKNIDKLSPQNNEEQYNHFTGFDFSYVIEKLNNHFNCIMNSDIDLFLLWNEFRLTCDFEFFMNFALENQSKSFTQDLYFSHVIQCCRHISKMEDPYLSKLIKVLLTKFHMIFLRLLRHQNVSKILDIINVNEDLSGHLLSQFNDFYDQIIVDSSLLMKWLNMIENVHFLVSIQLISLLEKLISQSYNFSVIILMKIESIVTARIDMILGAKFDMSSNGKAIEIVKSLSKYINNSIVPMEKLKRILSNIENSSDELLNPQKTISPVLDPLLVDKIDQDELNEKKFWKLCVEKSLKYQDQDIRLGPRLLQGGSAVDLEQLFFIKLDTDNCLSESNKKNDIISNLPPRFVQQCLRLGFLRSGGGVVQEGVRVDLIFRLGEKLLFEELNYILDRIKMCIKFENFIELSPTIVLGLLAALNDYLSLSCQLSVPIPVSNIVSENLVSLIENLCVFITKSNTLHSRLLIEELLTLITVCYGSSSLLTDEGMKFMGTNLTLKNISVIVDFFYLLVDQFSSNTLSGSMKYSLTINKDVQNSIRTLLILDKILKYYYTGQMDNFNTELQRKLKLAIISIARLPCVIVFTRNPKNIKDVNYDEMERIISNPSYKNIVEIDCLLKMNRDDLASAQTILNSLGWTDRLMFEESWSLFLTLLHDKGPSGALSEKNENKPSLSSEEVVEQGHCDSLGLLGLTDMILQTTARPNSGNPVVAQLEHKTRDKTPNLLHTKTGRKLCMIHMQLEEEIFHCHRGFKMFSSGWSITSWNLEREDSVLKYRHDQINISVLAKRISIGSRSPQISGSNSGNLDVLSCLHSLPILCQQWFECINVNKQKAVALWPRACALRCAVMLMDLFSSKEQIQWLLDCLLELDKTLNVEDDWITTSWVCIGLSKCVSVLETSSNSFLPQTTSTGKPPNAITTASIYGLSKSIKLIESCLNSDLTILQQSALHSAMCLLQMTVYAKNSWELPPGSLVELRNMHDMVMRYLDNQLLLMECNSFNTERRVSFPDSFHFSNSINSNTLSQAMSSGAASIASTVSGFTSMNSVNTQLSLINTGFSNSVGYVAPNTLPRLLKSNQNVFLRTERHNYLIMATACFYCERYPDAISESDILNNFVTLAKNIMQVDKKKESSPQLLLTMCRCLERISLTQRIGIIVTEQIIRICGNYLKNCKSTTHSLPVLGLFLTSCYLSLANSNITNPSTTNQFESVFYNGPSSSNGENQLVMLERINLFWKRLTDQDTMDAIESRILSRLISNIMTEFMSGEELLNKTIHQLLRSWPRSQCVAKTLFDVITKCLNQPDGEKLIRKWTLLVLQSLTSCRPENLSIWATTIVLIASASSSRSCLRALFSQCLDWLTRFERGDDSMSELETALCLAAIAFVQDMSHDPAMEVSNRLTFTKAMQSGSNIPAFQKFFNVAREKHIL